MSICKNKTSEKNYIRGGWWEYTKMGRNLGVMMFGKLLLSELLSYNEMEDIELMHPSSFSHSILSGKFFCAKSLENTLKYNYYAFAFRLSRLFFFFFCCYIFLAFFFFNTQKKLMLFRTMKILTSLCSP